MTIELDNSSPENMRASKAGKSADEIVEALKQFDTFSQLAETWQPKIMRAAFEGLNSSQRREVLVHKEERRGLSNLESLILTDFEDGSNTGLSIDELTTTMTEMLQAAFEGMNSADIRETLTSTNAIGPIIIAGNIVHQSDAALLAAALGGMNLDDLYAVMAMNNAAPLALAVKSGRQDTISTIVDAFLDVGGKELFLTLSSVLKLFHPDAYEALPGMMQEIYIDKAPPGTKIDLAISAALTNRAAEAPKPRGFEGPI